MALNMFRDLVEDTVEQRRNFFKLLYGKATGYVAIAYINKDDRRVRHEYFPWPSGLESIMKSIDENTQELVHCYFGVSLYEKATNRTKENVKQSTCLWADLDTCDPRLLLVEPSILVQSSPGKYQALWLLEDPVEPWQAEEYARRIAYYHADDGADKCWDASHILRIPYTPNFKYGDLQSAPIVAIVHAERLIYRPKDFEVYPEPKAIKQITNTPPEERRVSNKSLDELLSRMSYEARDLYEYVPDQYEDWSTKLWNLNNKLKEDGFSREEIFTIAWNAGCNKYKRDGRPETDLWRELDKVEIKHIEVMRLAPTAGATIPELLNKEEIDLVLSRETFVERYIAWASKQTDAATQYHQSGAFIILSALLAGNIKLPTSFGRIIPNLWFMLLGDTTLTRKTTAMDMAMGLLYDVDERLLLATDGSLEGILVGLRDRPHQSSIFLRDEFSGLLEAIAHKDYMAGFAEQLTKLYDGQPLKRLLRKETIDIRDPIFLMYVGGIKTKTQMLLTEELVMGGFLPRFVIITARPDLSRVRPIGPPKERETEHRDAIKNELMDLFAHYVNEIRVNNNGESLGRVRPVFEASLTPEAWLRYNEYELLLTKTALDAGLEYLTPVYDRLAKSTLKAAMLIAASTQRTDRVVVHLQDLLHAIYYARFWREYASEIVNGVGKSYDERLMDRIYLMINSSSLGMHRSELMKKFQLDVKRADMIFRTLEQRHLIVQVDAADGKRYQAL